MSRATLLVLSFGAVACSVEAPHYYNHDGALADANVSDGDVNQPDAIIDAHPVDPSAGPWSFPSNLSISTHPSSPPKTEYSDLKMYYVDPSAGNGDIYFIARPYEYENWGTGGTGPLDQLNTSGLDQDPAPSPDGLELYFDRAGTIYVSKRATTSDPWGPPMSTGLKGTDVDILSNNRVLYYEEPTANCPVATCRVRLTRADRSSPWGNPTLESVTNYDAYGNVDYSGDGLHALLSFPNDPVLPSPIVLSRPTLDAAWGAYAPLPGITNDAGTPFTWESASWTWGADELYLVRYSQTHDVAYSKLGP